MSATMEQEDERPLTKQQVNDFVPKRIKELRFGIMSAGDIVNQSVVEVSDRHVYDFANGTGERRPTRHGPLDPRMGSTLKHSRCDTCGRPEKECNGHFGHVKLALPAFHIGFMKKIIDVLQCICKDCAQVLLTDDFRRTFLRRMRKPGIDNMERKNLCKKVNTECRKVQYCPHCGATNGAVKKVAGHALKIIHDKYRRFNASTSKSKIPPDSKVIFDQSFEEAKRNNQEIEKHMKKAFDDLNPLRVLNLFRKIEASDCELLGMDPAEARPEMFIWQYIPAPPVPIRPSVQQDTASNEDDITNKLGDIIQISSLIRAGIERGQPIQTLMEQWEYLQIQVAMIINSDQPSLQQPGFGKTIRSFCQRLKGKGGRFRGNLSGKRVDFSGRTVISPDPNLSIEEVAVPQRVAKNMTYPERCTRYNRDKLRKLIIVGGLKWPGANFVERQKDGRKINLSLEGETGDKIRKRAAESLEYGDIVLRHLEDGDIVLFNRQPSLHKLSIMSHRVKVREWRTFRLNECVCSPYNADFDGDEMNLHVPQTEEARTEATELMGVKYNLATPKDGTPIIAATQDFITAAYLLSNKDRFYDRSTFVHICNYMFRGEAAEDELLPEHGGTTAANRNALVRIDLPEPAILKPQALWTGKQVFNVLIRPSKKSRILVNLDAACKTFKAPKKGANDLAENDSWLVIRNSEIMCGLMDKATVGGGKKDSLFYVLMRDYGPEAATRCMNRLARLAARWLSNEGFSIGITDVYPGSELTRRKTNLIANAYDECDKVIKAYKDGTLEKVAGSAPEIVMEKKMSEALSAVRQKAAEICFEELTRWNSPVIMAQSGSKGSNINVSQMVASVGQQIIGGERIGDGFQDRSLPHFPKAARQPPSRGFVANSFFTGLTPSEFIFHAMSGREGLVDTAVKTAETGYMSRRLMKSLEDLSAQYDMTVRTAANNVVQFAYGQDGLDPADMEGKGRPVHYERTWLHARTITWNNAHPSLLPWEVKRITKAVLDRERAKYTRKDLLNRELDYSSTSKADTDDKEFVRSFLDAIEEFVGQLAEKLATTRKAFHLHPCLQEDERQDADVGGVEAMPPQTSKGSRKTARNGKSAKNAKAEPGSDETASRNGVVNTIAKISRQALEEFLRICLEKYERARVQPGHAVGAVGAQSIGEPGTQMTLKTFHFAGVAGMSMTQGVPRIKEIINASKTISTPIITCSLLNPFGFANAKQARARIEKTFLRDVITSVDEVWKKDTVWVEVKVDLAHVANLGLDITMTDIRRAVAKHKGLGLTEDCIQFGRSGRLKVILPETPSGPKSRAKTDKDQEEYFIRLQALMRNIPDVVITGYRDVAKCVISKTPTKNPKYPGANEHQLYVEGYGFRECMTTPGIVFNTVSPNNIMEVMSVLGIEAARQSIIDEINKVLGSQMDIDPRHMQLLADVMTFKGDVLGITRFGLAKMRDSVLQLASFEKTPDHLFDAAINGKSDQVEGVSESIIMGQSMMVGTGAMRIVKLLDLTSADFAKKPTVFEDEWNTTASE